MDLKTKAIIFLISILIMLSFIPVAFSMSFTDIPTDFWAYKEIGTLSDTGIINGYPDGTYKPHGTITKGEFLKLVLITCFPEEESFSKETKENEHWAQNYYDFAKKYNLVDSTWNKDNLIKKRQL